MKKLKMKNRDKRRIAELMTRGRKHRVRMRYFVLVLSAIVLISCDNEDEVTIKGFYPDGEGETLTLEMLNVNQLFPLGSVDVKNNGRFKIRIDLDNPELVLVKNEQEQTINLLPFPGDVISLDIPCIDFSNCYTVQGSNESSNIKLLINKVRETKMKLDSISNLLSIKEEVLDSDPLIAEFSEIFKAQKMYNIKYVVENLSSLSSIYALYQRIGPEDYIFSETRDLQYLKIVADSVKNKYPNSSLVGSLVKDVVMKEREYERFLLLNKANNHEVTVAGHIDLKITDKNGNEKSLNSLKGKVILLNFWASFDQSSRESNILLKSVYNKYNSNGFEVYSVSLDNNKAAWLDAIRFEEYSWIDVCELSYPESYAASSYNIGEIPTSYLIDREGNIVAKNLNGKVLSTWLDNLL